MKKFLCTVDPIGLTMGLMLTALIIVEMFLMGFGVVLLIFVVGAVVIALAGAIAWCLYKAIAYAQGHCDG